MGLQVGQGRERRQRLPLAQARGDHLRGRIQQSDRRDHLLRADRAAPTELLAYKHRHLDLDLQRAVAHKIPAHKRMQDAMGRQGRAQAQITLACRNSSCCAGLRPSNSP